MEDRDRTALFPFLFRVMLLQYRFISVSIICVWSIIYSYMYTGIYIRADVAGWFGLFDQNSLNVEC